MRLRDMVSILILGTIPTLVMALTCSSVAAAQVPSFSLGKRNAAISEPFSDAFGIAEMRDGWVVVADRITVEFVLADFTTGQRRQLGRTGAGPNEYLTAFGVIRWRGDTLLGYDSRGRRFIRIAPDGSLAGSIPFPTRTEGAAFAPPRGVDRQGRIYWDSPIIDMTPTGKRSMRARIVRWLPGDPAVEVVAGYSDHAPEEHSFRYRAYPKTDAWVVAGDGRVGIISAAEYRLKWMRGASVVESGPRILYPPTPMARADREAFRDRKALEPTSGAGPRAGGGAVPRAGDRARAFWPDSLFPQFLPPFEEHAALVAPNGDVWIRRTSSASEVAARVDVLDPHGRLRATLRLPPRAKLLGLGESSVYLISTDDDGLQTLERYGYPPLPK